MSRSAAAWPRTPSPAKGSRWARCTAPSGPEDRPGPLRRPSQHRAAARRVSGAGRCALGRRRSRGRRRGGVHRVAAQLEHDVVGRGAEHLELAPRAACQRSGTHASAAPAAATAERVAELLGRDRTRGPQKRGPSRRCRRPRRRALPDRRLDQAAASRSFARLRWSTRETCICDTPTRCAIASCVRSPQNRSATICASRVGSVSRRRPSTARSSARA